MTILEATKLADFTPREIACKSKYMWVYHQAEKILKWGSAFLTPPTAPTRSVEVVGYVSMSSVTLSESVTTPPSPLQMCHLQKWRRGLADWQLLSKPIAPKSSTKSNNTKKTFKCIR